MQHQEPRFITHIVHCNAESRAKSLHKRFHICLETHEPVTTTWILGESTRMAVRLKLFRMYQNSKGKHFSEYMHERLKSFLCIRCFGWVHYTLNNSSSKLHSFSLVHTHKIHFLKQNFPHFRMFCVPYRCTHKPAKVGGGGKRRKYHQML